jgi:pyruvate/2-oxoglutarate dehydrogenase complex dihydrolipoamide dehydrogenase (E3) component
MKYDFHQIVIGGGSAGLTAASGLAGLGAKVALVEKHRMGGDCLNYGCVPSKSFLKVAHTAKLLREAKHYGLDADYRGADIKFIMERVGRIIREIAPHDSQERFESLGVRVLRGTAEIVDRHTVMIDKQEKIRAKHILIATGSKPRIPELKGLRDIDYHTNETIFELETLPKHLIVLGGGPIGLEIGQGFRHLGSQVSIIDHNNRLFPKDDAEVWDTMKRVFQEEGIDLVLGATPEEVLKDGDKFRVVLEQKGRKTEIIGDVLLVSAGRLPDTEGLNLSRVGIKTDKRGYVITDLLQCNFLTYCLTMIYRS